MKKSLLLAVAALLGLAPQAKAVEHITQVTNEYLETVGLQDGDILILQTPSSTGNQWSFWNGCQTLTTSDLSKTGLLKVVAVENDTKFYLQNYSNPTQYIADASCTWTTDKNAAAKWTASVPADGGYADDGTQPSFVHVGENTVRFARYNTANSASYLNCQKADSNPAFGAGQGGWSWWYTYIITEEEAEALGDTFNPEMVTCYYVYESPQYGGSEYAGKEYGMPFATLSGIDVTELTYYQTYQTMSKYFKSVTLGTYDNKVVSEDNCEFPVTIEWNEDVWMNDWEWFSTNYKEKYSKVGRYTLNPGDTEDYISYSVIYDGKLRGKNPNKLFDPGHMWYLDDFGLDPFGYPTVKMMSVQFPGQGLFFDVDKANHTDNVSATIAQVSPNPTELTMYPTTATTVDGDFVLGVSDPTTSKSWFINDRTVENVHFFTTWYQTLSVAQGAAGCVMRYSALEDDEFDEFENQIAACGYLTYKAEHPNDVDLSHEAIEKAKTTRAPEDVTALFPENTVMMNGLRTYKDLVGLNFYDSNPDVVVAGYETPAEVKDLYDALDNFNRDDDATTLDLATKRWQVVNGYNPTPQYTEMTAGVVFLIRNEELSSRGYLCNVNGTLASTKSNLPNKPVLDRTNANGQLDDFLFTFVDVDGKRYMYNLGAEKFLNGFGERAVGTDRPVIYAASEHSWRFSDIPTEFRGTKEYEKANHSTHAIMLMGGMKTGTDANFSGQVHEGGLSMCNNANLTAVVSLGMSGRTDGSGLIFDGVRVLTDEEYQALVDKVNAAHQGIVEITSDFSAIDGIVNHITEETHKSLADITVDETIHSGQNDHIHWVMENGARQEFDDNEVYNLFDGDKAYKFDVATEDFVLADFDATNDAFNLKVVKGAAAAAASDLYFDGEELYSFVHTFNEAPKTLTIDGNTQHALDMSELGKIKIGDKAFVAKLGSGKAETTSISELRAEKASKVLYDLSGRRVASPKSGIYVTGNGKKIVL